MFAFGDVHAIWRLEVVTGHDVIDVVDSSGSKTDFSEVSWPDSTVGVLGLILGVVGGIDVVVDESISVIPLLIVILFEVMVSRVDGEVLTNPCGQFKLFVHFIQEQVVFFADHSVAVGAVSGENLEAFDKIQQE